MKLFRFVDRLEYADNRGGGFAKIEADTWNLHQRCPGGYFIFHDALCLRKLKIYTINDVIFKSKNLTHMTSNSLYLRVGGKPTDETMDNTNLDKAKKTALIVLAITT